MPRACLPQSCRSLHLKSRISILFRFKRHSLSPSVHHVLFPSLQAAVRGTNYYEAYTGIELPLKKLDFMGIPGLGGAVENWGLLQFDERRMLVNEVSPTQ